MPTATQLPNPRQIIREPQLLQKIGVCGQTLRRWEAAGVFPARIKLSPAGGFTGAIGWDLGEVDDWLAERRASRTVS